MGERPPSSRDENGGAPDRLTERATMRDVAALAGVSLKTVSRVVNREPNVSAPIIAKVTRAVERLNYRHNVGASNLRSRRTGVIGALLQDVGNSFSAGLLRALEDVAGDVTCQRGGSMDRALTKLLRDIEHAS